MSIELSFTGLTVEQINEKLKKLPYEDVVDLLVSYQCPITELGLRIAQSQGLKVPKKNEPKTFDQIALCQMVYSQQQIVEAILKSNKILEGVLKDINNAAARIADKLEQ